MVALLSKLLFRKKVRLGPNAILCVSKLSSIATWRSKLFILKKFLFWAWRLSGTGLEMFLERRRTGCMCLMTSHAA